MDPVYQVVLDGGGPWGFRLQGGKDFGIPLNIARITPGSKAAIKNMMVGDAILEINGTPTEQLSHMDAQNVIKNSGNRLELKLRQGSGVSIGDQNARAMGAAAAQPKVLLSTDLTHSAGVDHKFNAKPRPFFGSSPASTEVSPVTSPQEAPKPVVQAPKFSASAYAHKKKEELERRQNEKVSMEDSEVLKMIQKSKISDDNKHPQPYNGSQQPQQDETVEVTAPQAFKMVYSGRDIHEEVPASSRGVIDSLKERQKESASGLSSESKVPSRVFQMLQKQYGDEEEQEQETGTATNVPPIPPPAPPPQKLPSKGRLVRHKKAAEPATKKKGGQGPQDLIASLKQHFKESHRGESDSSDSDSGPQSRAQLGRVLPPSDTPTTPSAGSSLPPCAPLPPEVDGPVFRMVYESRDIKRAPAPRGMDLIESLKVKMSTEKAGLSTARRMPSRLYKMLQEQYGVEDAPDSGTAKQHPMDPGGSQTLPRARLKSSPCEGEQPRQAVMRTNSYCEGLTLDNSDDLIAKARARLDSLRKKQECEEMLQAKAAEMQCQNFSSDEATGVNSYGRLRELQERYLGAGNGPSPLLPESRTAISSAAGVVGSQEIGSLQYDNSSCQPGEVEYCAVQKTLPVLSATVVQMEPACVPQDTHEHKAQLEALRMSFQRGRDAPDSSPFTSRRITVKSVGSNAMEKHEPDKVRSGGYQDDVSRNGSWNQNIRLETSDPSKTRSDSHDTNARKVSSPLPVTALQIAKPNSVPTVDPVSCSVSHETKSDHKSKQLPQPPPPPKPSGGSSPSLPQGTGRPQESNRDESRFLEPSNKVPPPVAPKVKRRAQSTSESASRDAAVSSAIRSGNEHSEPSVSSVRSSCIENPPVAPRVHGRATQSTASMFEQLNDEQKEDFLAVVQEMYSKDHTFSEDDARSILREMLSETREMKSAGLSAASKALSQDYSFGEVFEMMTDQQKMHYVSLLRQMDLSIIDSLSERDLLSIINEMFDIEKIVAASQKSTPRQRRESIERRFQDWRMRRLTEESTESDLSDAREDSAGAGSVRTGSFRSAGLEEVSCQGINGCLPQVTQRIDNTCTERTSSCEKPAVSIESKKTPPQFGKVQSDDESDGDLGVVRGPRGKRNVREPSGRHVTWEEAGSDIDLKRREFESTKTDTSECSGPQRKRDGQEFKEGNALTSQQKSYMCSSAKGSDGQICERVLETAYHGACTPEFSSNDPRSLKDLQNTNFLSGREQGKEGQSNQTAPSDSHRKLGSFEKEKGEDSVHDEEVEMRLRSSEQRNTKADSEESSDRAESHLSRNRGTTSTGHQDGSLYPPEQSADSGGQNTDAVADFRMRERDFISFPSQVQRLENSTNRGRSPERQRAVEIATDSGGLEEGLPFDASKALHFVSKKQNDPTTLESIPSVTPSRSQREYDKMKAAHTRELSPSEATMVERGNITGVNVQRRPSRQETVYAIPGRDGLPTGSQGERASSPSGSVNVIIGGNERGDSGIPPREKSEQSTRIKQGAESPGVTLRTRATVTMGSPSHFRAHASRRRLSSSRRIDQESDSESEDESGASVWICQRADTVIDKYEATGRRPAHAGPGVEDEHQEGKVIFVTDEEPPSKAIRVKPQKYKDWEQEQASSDSSSSGRSSVTIRSDVSSRRQMYKASLNLSSFQTTSFDSDSVFGSDVFETEEGNEIRIDAGHGMVSTIQVNTAGFGRDIKIVPSAQSGNKITASGVTTTIEANGNAFYVRQNTGGDRRRSSLSSQSSFSYGDLPPPPPELIDEELSEEKAPGIQSRTFMRLQHAVDTGEGDNVATVFSQPPGQRSKAVPMPNTSAHFGPKGQQTTSVNAIPKPPMPGGPSPPSGPNFRISTPKAPTINKAPPTQSYNKSPSAFTPAAPSSAPSHASQVVHTRSSPKPVSPAETGRTPRCYGCDELIKGPFVSAIGKCWHPEHFCCASCHSSLQNQGFVEEQNKLYCEKCFNDFFAPKCAACGKSIVGNCINAIGKAFHPEHFVCSKCGKPFGNEGFLIEAGKPYCEADYDELFGVKCAQCRRSITGGERYVEALDKNWHSDCFSCGVCHTKLEGSSFYVVQGRPYCGQHKGGY